MIFIEFPITGPLRIPLLMMEWILIIICFELSLNFLFRYKKQEKDLRNFQELGYFALTLGFSSMSFFYIISDYYSSSIIISNFYIWGQGSERYIFLNCGYFSIMIGAFFFLLCIEKYKVFLFKKYFFTFIFLVSVILFSILFFIDIRITQTITYIFWPVFIFFLLIYLIDFINKAQNREKRLIGLIKYLSGFVFLLLGFLFTTDLFIDLFGLTARLLGAASQLIGICFLSYFYLTLPPFSEFDWQEKIEAVFLINNAGICLYYKIFTERKDLKNEQLISAAISSINIILQNITDSEKKSKGISVIKKKGANLIFYSSTLVSGVLYTSEELNYPKIVLKEFVEKFETLYNNILMDWNGDMKIFETTDIIANNLFTI